MLDDPNAGRFGFLRERGGYRASANVEPVRGLYHVTLFLTVTGLHEGDAPDHIVLHLHPSFGAPRQVRALASTRTGDEIRVTQHPLVCYGSFTVGIEVFRRDGSSVRLELDLADTVDDEAAPGLRETFIADGLW